MGDLGAYEAVATQSRGRIVESVHFGAVAVVGADEKLVARVGDVHRPIFPRSALKPLQGIAMLRAGLVLTDRQLAVAVASHSGSPTHIDLVLSILEQHHIPVDALQNSPDLPYGANERTAWIGQGGGPSVLTQNCSGKHAAMLATCAVNGWNLNDYLDERHPLQRAIRAQVESLTGTRVEEASIDGCGAPVFAVPLVALARSYSRMVLAEPCRDERTVANAMRLHPELVSGAGRDVALAMRAQPGLLAKDGFEGIQVFAQDDGTAVAVKIADGGDRARVPVAVSALRAVTRMTPALAALGCVPVSAGHEIVGELVGLPIRELEGTDDAA